MSGDAGVTVVTTLVCSLHLSHARLRVHWAPGIPCALYFLGEQFLQKLGRIAPWECGVVSDARGMTDFFCRIVGWAKRKRAHHSNAIRARDWWARRKRAFAHPTKEATPAAPRPRRSPLPRCPSRSSPALQPAPKCFRRRTAPA